MAKIIFRIEGKTQADICGAVLNDTVLNSKIPSNLQNKYQYETISDTDYNNWITGAKAINFDSNNAITFVDPPSIDSNVSKATFEEDRKVYKEKLEKHRSDYSSHPKDSDLSATLTFINNMDLSTISDDNQGFEKYLKDNNKLVLIQYI